MNEIREVIRKNMKYILNTGFIVLITVLMFRLLFKGQELSEIIEDIHSADGRWIALGAVFVFLFIAGESVIIRYMLRVFGKKQPFYRCLRYSFIGFFFSYITPSSSGGQPAQMFYMKKDGVQFGFSTLIMLVITIAYKSALVVLGLVFLCFKFEFLCDCVGGMGWLLILGFTLNIACIIAFALVFFKPVLARRLCIRLVNFLTWVKLIKSKNSQKYVIKIKKICDNYTAGAEYMKENLHTVLNVFLITVVQRMFLFAVTWVVYKAYGLSGTSFLSIVAVQIMIAISVEMLPLPGAAGVTEGCFLYMFSGLFGEELVKPALLLSRGLTFYAVLVVGGIVTLATHILSINTEKEDEEI